MCNCIKSGLDFEGVVFLLQATLFVSNFKSKETNVIVVSVLQL